MWRAFGSNSSYQDFIDQWLLRFPTKWPFALIDRFHILLTRIIYSYRLFWRLPSKKWPQHSPEMSPHSCLYGTWRMDQFTPKDPDHAESYRDCIIAKHVSEILSIHLWNRCFYTLLARRTSYRILGTYKMIMVRQFTFLRYYYRILLPFWDVYHIGSPWSSHRITAGLLSKLLNVYIASDATEW